MGREAFRQLELSQYLISRNDELTVITTAVLRRSGCYDQAVADLRNSRGSSNHLGNMLQDEGMRNWIVGKEDPSSREMHGAKMTIDVGKFMDVWAPPSHLRNMSCVVVASREMRIILGSTHANTLQTLREADESPLQQKSIEQCDAEIQDALLRVCDSVYEQEELLDATKAAVSRLLNERYTRVWRAKFDLEGPAILPPMHIELVAGAQPKRIRRHYRWDEEQYEFLRQHLRKLVDAGIISRTQSLWESPIVLVRKQDLTFRVCIDPSVLNSVTVPMHWAIPRIREMAQHLLSGVRYMCKFDFVSMFWQIPLDEESRKLFCFYAGELGTYCFNRVAMGALNSSCYTQRIMTGLFENALREDGRPLLHNGLLVQTDDVLLYSKSQEEMIKLLDLFLGTVSAHNMAIHPGKIRVFCSSTVYCGLRISREGIGVDPDRLRGLKGVSKPLNVGDVWQFNAAAGWIRKDIPLFSEASSVLSEFVAAAIKGTKKKNMAAARRISLQAAGWKPRHQRAWDAIKDALAHTITSTFRDRRLRACLFTDASKKGWAYAITQCGPSELSKKWAEQSHQLLCVNSGRFTSNQLGWSVSCCELFPIRKASEHERHLLQGDLPWASINDHKSLTYLLDEPGRAHVVHVAAQGRLRRWAAYLRTHTFDTHGSYTRRGESLLRPALQERLQHCGRVVAHCEQGGAA